MGTAPRPMKALAWCVAAPFEGVTLAGLLEEDCDEVAVAGLYKTI